MHSSVHTLTHTPLLSHHFLLLLFPILLGIHLAFWPKLYLLDVGLQQVTEFLHEFCKPGPRFGVFVPAIQHDLVAVDQEHTERAGECWGLDRLSCTF